MCLSELKLKVIEERLFSALIHIKCIILNECHFRHYILWLNTNVLIFVFRNITRAITELLSLSLAPSRLFFLVMHSDLILFTVHAGMCSHLLQFTHDHHTFIFPYSSSIALVSGHPIGKRRKKTHTHANKFTQNSKWGK